MALDVGIVGPAGSGKTTLFTALTGVVPEGYGTPHVGIAPIADERLPALSRGRRLREADARRRSG